MPDPGFDPQSAITSAATQYGVDPDLALAIAQHGEGFGSIPTMGATSQAGAHGIMQLMPQTAKDLGVDLNDPLQNIQGGVRYIRQMQDQFGADRPDLIAAAYNAGPGAVQKYGGVPPFSETKAYVQRVTGALGDTLPAQADIDKAFGNPASQAAGPPAPPGAAPAAGDDELPPQADLEKAFGASPAVAGQRTITWDAKAGTYRDPATGIPYTRDAGDNTLFTDPKGAQYQVQNVPEPPVTMGGVAKAFGSGALNTVQSAADLPNPSALIGGGFDLGAGLGTLAAQTLGVINPAQRAALEQQLGMGRQQLLGQTPTEQQSALGLYYEPQNSAERLSSALGAAAPMAPAGPVMALRGALGSFAGSEGARALGAPPEVQSAAGLLGGGLSTVGPEVSLRVAKGLANATATPFMAAASRGAAETQAGGVLARNATDLPATRSALEGTNVVVPGSQPTTFQQTGDLGLGSLERGARATNPAPFQARAAEQNAARVTALKGIQTGGDPAALGKAVSDQFDQIDQDTQGAIDRATAVAQAQQVGGTATSESQGASLRSAITDAESGARQRESALWKAIDPEGKLTGNVTATTQAAKNIAGEVPGTAKPMSGEEAAIFDTAAGMPAVSPVSDLIALRSRVSTAMREELATNGRSPSYARMSQLRGAIQDNLAGTIGDSVAADQAAVQSGQMPQSQSATAKLQQVLDDARQRGEAVSFGGGAGSPGRNTGRGAAPAAGGSGTALPTGGGSGSAPGDQGVPGSAGPTFDDAAAQRLAAATAATKERAATFGVRPVSTVTQTTGTQGQFRMPDGSVPGQFFKSGPAGFNLMQTALKAGGDQAQGVLEDYAASTLRNEAMTDGVVDPKKFGAWQAKYGDALRALPADAQARFADAATAGQAVSDAAASRTAATKAYKASALGRFIGVSDPDAVTRTVGGILRSPTATQQIGAIADAVRGNPDATQGLRQALADHISNTLIGNTEVGTSGVEGISSDKFQTFVKANRAALGKVFSPSELDTLDSIAADLQQSNRSNTALKLAGSNTTQDITQAAKFVRATARGGIDLLGALVGAHTGLPGGEAIGGFAAEGMQRLRAYGINRVNDLVTQALLNPDVAKRLLAKVPNDPVSRQTAMSNLIRSLAVGVGSTQAATASRPPAQPASALRGVSTIPVRPPTNALQGVMP